MLTDITKGECDVGERRERRRQDGIDMAIPLERVGKRMGDERSEAARHVRHLEGGVITPYRGNVYNVQWEGTWLRAKFVLKPLYTSEGGCDYRVEWEDETTSNVRLVDFRHADCVIEKDLVEEEVGETEVLGTDVVETEVIGREVVETEVEETAVVETQVTTKKVLITLTCM